MYLSDVEPDSEAHVFVRTSQRNHSFFHAAKRTQHAEGPDRCAGTSAESCLAHRGAVWNSASVRLAIRIEQDRRRYEPNVRHPDADVEVAYGKV